MRTETQHPCVLVVDDEPDLCELIGDALRTEGLHVEAAGSGAEASEAIRRSRPDLVVADLHLPDCRGGEIIEKLRTQAGAIPTIVITGAADVHSASEALRHGCVDFLTKPLDLSRLRRAVCEELARNDKLTRTEHRQFKLRQLARDLNRSRHSVQHRLDTTCAALTDAYRTLNQQFLHQESVLRFHRQLLTCHTDDDVFRNLFSFFAERGGDLFGAAMVCDENADMQMIGRFGAPAPDSINICQGIGYSLLDMVLAEPTVLRVDPADHPTLFPMWLRPTLTGVKFLCMPLIPNEGELIGLVVLYRKEGESFDARDVAIAEMLAPSVATSIQGASYADGCSQE